jgi:hypothetical protein
MALKTTAVLGTPKRLNKHQPVIFLFVEAALREQVGALAPLPRRETYTENFSGAVFFFFCRLKNSLPFCSYCVATVTPRATISGHFVTI